MKMIFLSMLLALGACAHYPLDDDGTGGKRCPGADCPDAGTVPDDGNVPPADGRGSDDGGGCHGASCPTDGGTGHGSDGGGSCRNDDDCCGRDVCHDGTCRPPTTCSCDRDCPSGDTCRYGQCEPATCDGGGSHHHHHHHDH